MLLNKASFNKLKLRFDDIAPVIAELKQSHLFTTEQIGKSFLGRPIYSVTLGKGPIKVLFWSQMHGDEPTATAALMDLFQYMHQPGQKDWLRTWQNKLTIKSIPMLNPDGAEVFQRENAQGIDINRDARQLQSPEGSLLMSVARDFMPDFGFNLHDQKRHYAVGDTGKPATISVLAPPYNQNRDIDTARANAMRLIGDLIPVVEEIIPGQLARYDDEYSLRSFGDTFSQMGISTILVESGGNYEDANRQTARDINFRLFIAAINSLTTQSYSKQSLEPYHAIPLNKEGGMCDLIIRNITIKAEKTYQVDLAITLPIRGEKSSSIDMIGDLSVMAGYEVFDATGLEYIHKDDNQQDKIINETNGMATKHRPSLNSCATFFMANGGVVKLAVLDGKICDIEETHYLTE